MSTQAASSVPAGAQVFDAIYPGVSQKVALTSTSARSLITQAGTTVARVCSDVDCWIVIGLSPTATVTSMYLPAKIPTLIAVNGGSDFIAGITSSTGNLYITEGK